jgi:THO complex subunit 5
MDEFLALHPQHAELEEDELMLARIQHEHDEREAAKNKQMGLLKRKEELMHENSKRRAELEKLDKQLDEFVAKGMKPILDTFETVTMTADMA